MNPVSFGYKCKWLAIKSESPKAVMNALSIHNAKRAEWGKGIEGAYEGKAFISDPIDGWILVVCIALPDFGSQRQPDGSQRQPDTLTTWISNVSRKLDTVVQFFGTHRVVEYHSWCWSERGKIVRAYGYLGESGETIIDVGDQSLAEQALGFRFFDERKADGNDYWNRKDLCFPNEKESCNWRANGALTLRRLRNLTQKWGRAGWGKCPVWQGERNWTSFHKKESIVESLKIIALSVLSAVLYGILHDQVTARVCVEYFTIGHPPVFATESPTLLAFGWGIIATWWVGLLLGIPAALVSRLGPWPKFDAARLLRPIAILLGLMGMISLLAGIAGFFVAQAGGVWLVEPIASRVPAAKHHAFLADLWAHLAAYGVGFLGGIVLCVWVLIRRRQPIIAPSQSVTGSPN